MLFLLFFLLLTSYTQLNGALVDVGNGVLETVTDLKKYCEKIYGPEIAPYVDIYANSYRNPALFERIVQNTSDPQGLLKLSAVAMETNQHDFFQTIIQRIRSINPQEINSYFSSGYTLLLAFLAAHRPSGSIALLDKLMDTYGDTLDVNLSSKAGSNNKHNDDPKNIGFTPIFVAAQTGNTRLCKKLLSRKDIELDSRRSDGATAFLIAAECRHKHILELLYNHAKKYNKSLDVNSKTYEKGTTPLITSMGEIYDPIENTRQPADDNIPKRLVSAYGADVNLPLTATGASPLFWATTHGRFELAEFLISKGADITHTSKDGSNVLHILTAQIDAVYTEDAKLPTHNLEKFLKAILLNNSHLWTMQSLLGNAPLHNAIIGNENLTRILLKTAQSLPIADYQHVPTKTGRTALHCAAAQGNAPIIRLLLEHNADPYKKDDGGYSAIDLAVACKKTVLQNILDEKKEAEQQKKLSKKAKRQKKKRLALNVERDDACPFCGVVATSCPCASSSASGISNPLIVSVPQQINFSFTQIPATELFDFNYLNAPEDVCAMRNRSSDGLTNNVLIGYKQNKRGECVPIDESRYLCYKESDTVDTYHSIDRAFDPCIIGYGIPITHSERETEKHKALLEKYSITVRPGHTAYVLPGRIENAWYDTMLSLEHRDIVSAFGGGHDGAFVIITDNNGKIRHKFFHPSQEQKAIRSAWRRT